MKAFQTGDVSGIDSVVSDNFLDHTDRGDMTNRDSLKAVVTWVHANRRMRKQNGYTTMRPTETMYIAGCATQGPVMVKWGCQTALMI